MPGPLPNAQRRRTNAPVIPTTALPASGRVGRAPTPPTWIVLGAAGKAWWSWAWHTPQAAAWAAGTEVLIARRASLEDDLVLSGLQDGLDIEDDNLRSAVSRLASLATGRLGIMREMRELDDRLGLSPKAMAALRWSIAVPAEEPKAAVLTAVPDQWRDAAAG